MTARRRLIAFFLSKGQQNVPLPEGMPERVVINRWFAKVYHWTPDQVASLDLDDFLWLPVVEEAAHEAQEFLNKQTNKTSQGPIRR